MQKHGFIFLHRSEIKSLFTAKKNIVLCRKRVNKYNFSRIV